MTSEAELTSASGGNQLLAAPGRTQLADPTPEELAAIIAAVELSWPRPVVAAPAPHDTPRWRFAGRWWAKPIAARRDRPW